jgi:hypothetical protein
MCPKPITGYRQDYNTLWRGKLVIGHDPDRSARCRRWVKNGSVRARVARPFYPQTQKSDHATWKSALLPGADMAGRVESRLATPVLSGLSRPSNHRKPTGGHDSLFLIDGPRCARHHSQSQDD